MAGLLGSLVLLAGLVAAGLAVMNRQALKLLFAVPLVVLGGLGVRAAWTSQEPPSPL